MMKKILGIVIFALIFNLASAKEIKKSQTATKTPATVIRDIPKVGKTAVKTSAAKTKSVTKDVAKGIKNNTKSAAKEVKNVAKTGKKKLNAPSVSSSKESKNISQPESRKLLAAANKKAAPKAEKKIEPKKAVVKTKIEKKEESKKVIAKAKPEKVVVKKVVVKENKTAIPLTQNKKISLANNKNLIAFTTSSKTIKLGQEKRQSIKLAAAKTIPFKNPKNNDLGFLDYGNQRSALIKIAKSFIGTPYRYGSMNPKRGFDCSGFTSYVFLQKGIKLPRSSSEQYSRLAKVSKPQAGDLVFFRHGKKIGHVGIYLGNGMMVHSPQTGDRVKIESMEKPNWKRRYAGARKAINTNTNSMIALNK